MSCFLPWYKQLSQIKRTFRFQLNYYYFFFGLLCPLGKPVYLNTSEVWIKKVILYCMTVLISDHMNLH